MTAKSNNRKLIFHIGHHKAGSTTIQNALATKRLLVRDKRLLYTSKMAHNYLAKDFKSYSEKDKARANLPNNL